MKDLDLSKFDLNGIFELEDSNEIETLVSLLPNGKFLSRNKDYYGSKTITEQMILRDKLKSLLNLESQQKTFIVIENMLNASARVYYKELQLRVEGNNNEIDLEKATACMEEDAKNLIGIIEGKKPQLASFSLPLGNLTTTDKYIELDNKIILYIYVKSFDIKGNEHIVSPGLGSIYIGPFFKNIFNLSYTTCLYSQYSRDNKLQELSQLDTKKLMSNSDWSLPDKNILLLDDNIATARTLNSLKQYIDKYNECKYGGVLYNWRMYKLSNLHECDYPTFDISKIDFLTPLDDPGYWVYRDTIEKLKISGIDYINKMNYYGFRIPNKSDIGILLENTKEKSKIFNIDFLGAEENTKKPKYESICFFKKFMYNMKEILDKNKYFKSNSEESKNEVKERTE